MRYACQEKLMIVDYTDTLSDDGNIPDLYR